MVVTRSPPCITLPRATKTNKKQYVYVRPAGSADICSSLAPRLTLPTGDGPLPSAGAGAGEGEAGSSRRSSPRLHQAASSSSSISDGEAQYRRCFNAEIKRLFGTPVVIAATTAKTGAASSSNGSAGIGMDDDEMTKLIYAPVPEGALGELVEAFSDAGRSLKHFLAAAQVRPLIPNLIPNLAVHFGSTSNPLV